MRRRCQRPPSSWKYRTATSHWVEIAPVVELGMPVGLETENAGLAGCANDEILYPGSA